MLSVLSLPAALIRVKPPFSRSNLRTTALCWKVWAGVGLVRGGAGTALVGDGPTVAARINEYAELGIDSFILSGYPHLEEAYKVGELLFPHLDVAIPEVPPPQRLQLQGEAVANEFIPRKAAQS